MSRTVHHRRYGIIVGIEFALAAIGAALLLLGYSIMALVRVVRTRLAARDQLA